MDNTKVTSLIPGWDFTISTLTQVGDGSIKVLQKNKMHGDTLKTHTFIVKNKIFKSLSKNFINRTILNWT